MKMTIFSFIALIVCACGDAAVATPRVDGSGEGRDKIHIQELGMRGNYPWYEMAVNAKYYSL